MEKTVFLHTLLILTLFTKIAVCYNNSSHILATTFIDVNGNSIYDPGVDKPLSGLAVSNGVDIVLTDIEGKALIDKGPYSIVFAIKPSGYKPVTPWYVGVSDRDRVYFGFRETVEGNELFIAWITDTHLASSSKEVSYALKVNATANPSEYLARVFREINKLYNRIDFIVNTGDIVADANWVDKDTASKWFTLYRNLTSTLPKPVYNTPGNHDLFGLKNPSIKEDNPLYGLGMYTRYLGPPYYSFNYGPYHFIVLSPHVISNGELIYSFPIEEVYWVEKDLRLSSKNRVIVFSHEPPLEWARDSNVDRVFELLKEVNATLFCGHWHIRADIEYRGLRVYVSPALSGRWWCGSSRDGFSYGYTLVYLSTRGVNTLFREVGSSVVIELKKPYSVSISSDREALFTIYPSNATSYLRVLANDVELDVDVLDTNVLWTTVRIDLSCLDVGWIDVCFYINNSLVKKIPFYINSLGNSVLNVSTVKDRAFRLLGRKVSVLCVYTGYELSSHTYIFWSNRSTFLLGTRYLRGYEGFSRGDVVKASGYIMEVGGDSLVHGSWILELFEQATAIGRQVVKPTRVELSSISVCTPLVVVEGTVTRTGVGYFIIEDNGVEVTVVDPFMSITVHPMDHVVVYGAPINLSNSLCVVVNSVDDVVFIREDFIQKMFLPITILCMSIICISTILYYKVRRRV